MTLAEILKKNTFTEEDLNIIMNNLDAVPHSFKVKLGLISGPAPITEAEVPVVEAEAPVNVAKPTKRPRVSRLKI